MNALIALALPAAAFCFGLGITLPLLQVERLFLFTDRPSLVDIITGLWNAGDMLIAALVAAFSLLFPAIKLLMLQLALTLPATRVPGWIQALSNWSMLDVVLVALAIFAAKTTGLATATTLPGLWFFAGSAILTAAISMAVKRRPVTPP